MTQQADSRSDCRVCRWIDAGLAVDTYATVAAFADGFPVTDGHLLIVPRRHAVDWPAMTEQEIRDSQILLRRLMETIRHRDPTVTGFNIGTNIGASAGQTLFHAHIHLIPRRDGDTDDPTGGVRGVIDGRRIY